MRDTGGLQTLISSERLGSGEYVDTHEEKLIQGIVGRPIKTLLVDANIYYTGAYSVALFGVVDKVLYQMALICLWAMVCWI